MGDFGPPIPALPGQPGYPGPLTVPVTINPTPPYGGGSGSLAWWQIPIVQVPAMIASIYQARAQAQIAQAGAYGGASNPYGWANGAYYPGPGTDDIGSGGISSQGIRVGSTTIGWPLIGLVGGMLILVQMQPFRRR